MKYLNKLILSSIFLAGCAAEPTIIPEEKKVEIDPAIMSECGFFKDDLPTGSTFEDTLIYHAEDAKTFSTCRKLNESKKQIIQRFLLNEKPKTTGTSPER
jgi:hypothetical protein